MFVYQIHFVYSNIVLERLISIIYSITFPKFTYKNIPGTHQFPKVFSLRMKVLVRDLFHRETQVSIFVVRWNTNIDRANTANKTGGNICARPVCCYQTGNRSAVKPLVRFFWIHVSESESFICVTEVVTNVTWYTDNWNSDSLLFPEHRILHVHGKGISNETFVDLNYDPERTIYPISNSVSFYKTVALDRRFCLFMFVSLIA